MLEVYGQKCKKEDSNLNLDSFWHILESKDYISPGRGSLQGMPSSLHCVLVLR